MSLCILSFDTTNTHTHATFLRFLSFSLKKRKIFQRSSSASFARLVSIEIENTGALKKLDRNQKCLNIVSRKVDLINLLWIDGQEWSFQLEFKISEKLFLSFFLSFFTVITASFFCSFLFLLSFLPFPFLFFLFSSLFDFNF